ncbi:unnamed protein product [Rhizophagus irregularis]|nr:unnamed protein product [Rhizophagus irregularis]
MGNNKKKSKTPRKQSVPVQEFVNAFTDAFTLLLLELLEGLSYGVKDNTPFVTKLLNSHIPEGDRVKPNVQTKKFVEKCDSFSSAGVTGIISIARHKARQQLDRLSSRYQNSLASLAQTSDNKAQQNMSNQSKVHVPIGDSADLTIDNSMNIDSTVDPSVAKVQPNQEGDLSYQQIMPSTSNTIGSITPPAITQPEPKSKNSKIVRLTMNNNVIHDTQQGQVRTIMIYDIPTACSHDLILELLKEWGQVLEISFKPQHKYQSIWTKMILKPKHDSEFVMRTWSKSLGDFSVRWFPGYWKLADRKVQEKFQCKFVLPDLNTEEGSAQYQSYYKQLNFEQYMLKLRAKSCTKILDKGKSYGIFFFESHEDLLRCMEAKHLWKPVQSHTLTRSPRQSVKDKKKNTTSSKGKAVDNKSKPSTHSRGKSQHDKRTEDTRSLLTQLLRLLVT